MAWVNFMDTLLTLANMNSGASYLPLMSTKPLPPSKTSLHSLHHLRSRFSSVPKEELHVNCARHSFIPLGF